MVQLSNLHPHTSQSEPAVGLRVLNLTESTNTERFSSGEEKTKPFSIDKRKLPWDQPQRRSLQHSQLPSYRTQGIVSLSLCLLSYKKDTVDPQGKTV